MWVDNCKQFLKLTFSSMNPLSEHMTEDLFWDFVSCIFSWSDQLSTSKLSSAHGNSKHAGDAVNVSF